MEDTHILIVDDDHAVLTLLRRLFRLEGFSVHAVSDGAEALEYAKTRAPNLVLLDYNLPGHTGLEVLLELRTLYPDLKIIFISGSGDVQLEGRARAAGATDFFNKPFNIAELAARTHQLVPF
jgi:DNA-binding response OmpR family regulator